MIEVKNLCFSYGQKQILNNICFSLEGRECVSVLGNNGVGKSTLITCLNKIRRASAGEVLIDGEDVLKMSRVDTAKCIAYVSQQSEVGQSTVFDTVLLGRKPHMKWTLSQHDLDISEQMLERIGMADKKLCYINELSGGEVQKVMLARALVQQPKLLLLDEPTSNLDPRNQHEMLILVRELAQEESFAVITVLHDLNLAIRYSERFLFLKDSEVYAYGGPETMTSEVINAVYGMDASITSCMGIPVIVPLPFNTKKE